VLDYLQDVQLQLDITMSNPISNAMSDNSGESPR
jgi:hypothetical protein